MKNRIARVLANLLLKILPKLSITETRRVYLEMTRKAALSLHETYDPIFSAGEFDRDMFKILFNIKYHDPTGLFIAHARLEEFYKLAKDGNPSFMKDPFFRKLRKNKDKEVRKILHVLDRNMK